MYSSLEGTGTLASREKIPFGTLEVGFGWAGLGWAGQGLGALLEALLVPTHGERFRIKDMLIAKGVCDATEGW